MIPILLDTNIYGRIVADANIEQITSKIAESDYVVLNFSLIREELRQTGKQKTFRGNKKLRPVLLLEEVSFWAGASARPR